MKREPCAPAWVKALGIAAILVVVLVAILHLTGHGMGGHGHGP